MNFLRSAMRGLWWGIKALRSAIITAFAALVLVFFVALIGAAGGPGIPSVPTGGALILNPEGIIVEQLTARDPLEVVLSGDRGAPLEVLSRDIVNALRTAKDDDKISTLVLSLDGLAGAGASQLHYIGSVIDEFKESGKPVVVYSRGFSQSQYLLASHADEIYMHPFGAVLFTGYGIYPTYMKSAFEKLKANVNVFRVGAYKTAAEPFLRDDLSDEARETFGGTLNDLWDAYVAEVSTARGIDEKDFRARLASVDTDMVEVVGDLGELALKQGLVDGLMTRKEWRNHMIGLVGENDKTYKHITFGDYLTAANGVTKAGGDTIAVIVAKGSILDGEQKAGNVGGDTVARLIREAREDSNVKAIVMRIDSGGGSAYASEIIRREVEAAQEDGIPFVTSMGSVAASGGYWIAATSDEIWAEPTTITGSIGILAIIPTFEKTFDTIGIHRDGVGTAPLSGAFDPLRPMSDMTKSIVDQAINNGYQKFIELVARGRDMAPEEVDAIARGRIWSGTDAKGLGLVDNLGTLDEAIAAAAARAEVTDYDISYFEDKPSAEQLFLEELFAFANLGDSLTKGARYNGPVQSMLIEMEDQLKQFASLNDPRGMYALCLECAVK